MKNIWKLSLLNVFLLFADQFSKGYFQSILTTDKKVIVPDVLNGVHIQNAAFFLSKSDFLSTQTAAIVNLFLYVVLIFGLSVFISFKRNGHLLSILGPSLIWCGLFGNSMDLFSYYYIANVFELVWSGKSLIVFNVSHVSIVAGIIFYIIDFFLSLKMPASQE